MMSYCWIKILKDVSIFLSKCCFQLLRYIFTLVCLECVVLHYTFCYRYVFLFDKVMLLCKSRVGCRLLLSECYVFQSALRWECDNSMRLCSISNMCLTGTQSGMGNFKVYVDLVHIC